MPDGYIKKSDAVREVDIPNLHRGIVSALQSVICDIPEADVQPVVHGQWDCDGRCSACKKRWDEDMRAHGQDWGYFDPMPPYCNNCGARMDLVD